MLEAIEAVESALHEAVSRGPLRVPPYPAAALRLQQVLANADYSTQEVIEAMRADPVFAANLLRLANSSFYRRGPEVTSLVVAVQRIGARELIRLAMAATVAKLANDEGPLHSHRREVWRKALSSAMVCERLSTLEGFDESEGFVAGLLHDVGKLLVVGALEDRWARWATLATTPPWEEIIERHHVRFGQVLAERWKLPGVLGAVVSSHHDATASHGPLTRLVVLGDAIVALMDSGVQVRVRELERLGLDGARASAIADLIPQVPRVINAFEPGAASPVNAHRARPHDGAMTLEVEGESSARVEQLAEAHVVVRTSRELVAKLMLEVTLQPVGLRFWAVVDEVRPSGATWLVKVKPFALAPEEAQVWQGLFASERRSA